MATTKTKAIPKNLAAVADLYYIARQERLDLQKSVDKLATRESELRDYLIDNLPKSKVGGITGKVANVEVVRKEVPTMEDRAKFFAYIKRSGAQDLLTQSLNSAAVKERWAAGKIIPGVGKHTVVTLSLHKVKTKK